MKKTIFLVIALCIAIISNAQNSELESLILQINEAVSLDNNEEALGLIDKAIKIDPNNHTLFFAKGGVLQSLGKQEQAILSYEKSIAVEVNYDAYYNLHVIYYNRAVEKYQLSREEPNQYKKEKLASEAEKYFLKAHSTIYD
nr:hypothetical protein [Bacteroidales bacterium]